MGLPVAENFRVFGPYYTQNSIFHSGHLIYQRPIVGIALKWHGVQKQCAKISASSGSSVDEKVFQFKPSFDEYLKAMESVKISREKQRSPGSGRSSSENGVLRDSGRRCTSAVGKEEGRTGLWGGKDGKSDKLKDSGGRSSGGVLMKRRDNGGLSNKKNGENGKFRDSRVKSTSFVVMGEGGDNASWMSVNGKNNVLRYSTGRSSGGILMKEGRNNGRLRRTNYGENGKLKDSVGKSTSVTVLKEGRENGRSRRDGKNDKLRDSSWRSSGTIPMKEGRDTGNLRRKKDSENGKLRDSGGKNTSLVVMKEGRDNGGLRSQNHGKNDKLMDSGARISGGFLTKEGRDIGGLSRPQAGEIDNLRDWEGEISSLVVTKGEGKSDGFGLVIAENGMVTDNKITGKEKVRKFTKKSTVDEDINGPEVLDMERHAFKPVKELEDIYGKPRISRAEMEEKIQKLAKCLNGADIGMPEWMFTKMMRSGQIRFSDYSMLRLIQILGKLGTWRRVLQVIEWIQLRERFKSHKLRHIYTTALDVLRKSRRPVEALNLFNSMLRHMSSYPDLVAYRSIAVTLGQAGHMKELFYVIDTMRSPPKKKLKTGVLEKWDPRLEPDIVVYNAVLNACVQRKKWEGAFWVLQQLKQQGQQVSTTTYGLVMEVMLACKKYNLVHEFFRKVQKSCIPNALNYKVLLNTLWREGKIDEAILAVKDMERRGIVGTASVYYDLARCLCSAGRCEEAMLQIDKLCKVANKPLVVTYTGLIQACIDSGNIENAAFMFNHMQNFCSPNLVTYNIMLKAFLDNGEFEEAKELFLTILGNRKVMPDRYTFNVMLDAFAAEQKWEDLEFAYVNMLKYGHHFNAQRHLKMVLDACTAGKEEILETTWKHLARGDRVPPFPLIDAMFCLKLKEGDLTEALSCFDSHPSTESQAFSTKWWLNFLMENSHLFEKHILVKLMHTADSLVTRTHAQKLILQKLRTSCEKFLSKQMKFDECDSLETATTNPSQTALAP